MIYLIDWDGCLSDDETIQYETYKELCDKHGLHLTKEMWSDFVGKPEELIWKELGKDLMAERAEIALTKTFPINSWWGCIKDSPAKKVILTRNYLCPRLVPEGMVDDIIVTDDKVGVIIEMVMSHDMVVVFEDSAKTLTAAKRLGCFTVGVKHAFNELPKCDIVFFCDSYKEGR